MKNLKLLQHGFIDNEIWTLTFGAAFQRASVYFNSPSGEQKRKLKSHLRSFVENELLPIYNREDIQDQKHIANIYSLSDASTEFSQILTNGKINFGVSQKILNLYLKYKWCLDEISEPPHFPVDRRIQENMRFRPIVAWTRFQDEIDYMRVINHVRNLRDENQSIALLELIHFERRINTEA